MCHTELLVREATSADVDVVTALRLQLLAEEARSPLFHRPRVDVEQVARGMFLEQVASGSEVTLLAECGRHVVGLLRCTVSRGTRLVRPSRYGFLTSAYVHPDYRRQGVLRAMLEHAEAWCTSRGLSEVRLHCTIENVEGNATWEALGYATAEVVRRRVLSPPHSP